MPRCFWVAVLLVAGFALHGCCKGGGYRACVASVDGAEREFVLQLQEEDLVASSTVQP